jgi:hypothetical protein
MVQHYRYLNKITINTRTVTGPRLRTWFSIGDQLFMTDGRCGLRHVFGQFQRVFDAATWHIPSGSVPA